jgi:hypothetical protein
MLMSSPVDRGGVLNPPQTVRKTRITKFMSILWQGKGKFVPVVF